MSVLGEVKIKGVTLDDPKNPYTVEALNNDITTFGQVVKVLCYYAGHQLSTAEILTMKIHREGKASVFSSVSLEKCEILVKEFAKVGVEAKIIEGL